MSTQYCRHIRTTGRRCGCPALADRAYCYFHDRSRMRHLAPRTRCSIPAAAGEAGDLVLHPMRGLAGKPDAFGQNEPMLWETPPPTQAQRLEIELDFPPLEDRESIQVAASMIVAALGRNRLDGKRAATMLYGLQVAAAVTRHDIVDPENDDSEYETKVVTSEDGSDLSAE